MPWPAIGAAVAGGLSLIGGARANKARREESARDRTFQGEQAGRQMRFQKDMRSTEWQAAVKDMEAAGINPALAYQQGGASSPGGASGSGSRANQENEVTAAVSSAMQYKRLNAELGQIRAATGKLDAEKDQIESGPRRVITPAVDAAAGVMNRLFQPRTMEILQYELGASARSIREALTKAVGKINSTMMNFPGSNSRLERRPRTRR